jgi:hypothetical protein
MEFGRTDLSLARVAEAHTDALAILAEANATPRDCSLYGVWASDGHGSLVRARPEADGTWRLSGVKQYCTGATFVKSALVTAHHGKDILLFDVDVAARGIRVEPSTWETPALADTATGPVSFDDVWVPGSTRRLLARCNWTRSLLGGRSIILDRCRNAIEPKGRPLSRPCGGTSGIRMDVVRHSQ